MYIPITGSFPCVKSVDVIWCVLRNLKPCFYFTSLLNVYFMHTAVNGLRITQFLLGHGICKLWLLAEINKVHFLTLFLLYTQPETNKTNFTWLLLEMHNSSTLNLFHQTNTKTHIIMSRNRLALVVWFHKLFIIQLQHFSYSAIGIGSFSKRVYNNLFLENMETHSLLHICLLKAVLSKSYKIK